jgi:hypothetical protein
MRLSLVLPVIAASMVLGGGVVRAIEPAASDGTKGESPLLVEMRERVAGVTVSLVEEHGLRGVTRLEHPVFRYSDEEREIFDATLWLWTDEGRPIALQKEEAAASLGEPKWTVCFASFASGEVDARWPRGGFGFRTTAPGCDFRAIPDGPEPAKQPRLIQSQIRQLSKRFAATLHYEGRGKSVSRLLARPIHEYSAEKQGVLAGAIFGFAAHGTNPDGYLQIELRRTTSGREWVYGCARMTIYGIDVSLDDKRVWTCEDVTPVPGYFERWCFFVEPRPERAGS